MDCKVLLNKIAESMLKNWDCEKISHNRYAVSTDMLLPNNDCIEIFIEFNTNDTCIISDMGLIFNYLFLHGIDLSDKLNKEKVNRLHKIVENYGATFIQGKIIKETTIEELPSIITLFIQAVRDASIFHYFVRPHTITNFKEQVYTFFASMNTYVNMDYSISGRIKTNHSIDIRLNGHDELLSKTISTTSSSQLQVLLERAWFTFDDIKAVGRKFNPAIFYDDTKADRFNALKDEHKEQVTKSGIPLFLFNRDINGIKKLAQQHILQRK